MSNHEISCIPLKFPDLTSSDFFYGGNITVGIVYICAWDIVVWKAE
jgi:hypothetical protein